MGYADLHIHSTYSPDATSTVRAILKQAKDVGLNVIAITDHDEIRGSLEANQLAPEYGIESITGAEISTKDGHLIALWIKELPPSGLSLLETLELIGIQGGIAIAPHPFNKLPNSLSLETVLNALTNPRVKTILRGIETHNMGTQAFDVLAQKLSGYLPLAKLASSDAHVYWAIGAGRTEFPGKTAQDLRYALDNITTVPIPYEENSSISEILHWTQNILLKKVELNSPFNTINSQTSSQVFNLAGDSTTDTPPPDVKKKKKK